MTWGTLAGRSPRRHGPAGRTRFHCDGRIWPLKEGDSIALLPRTDLSRAPSLPPRAEQLSAGSGSAALCVFGCAGEQEAVILPHGSGDRLVGVGSVGSGAPPS